MPSKRCRYCERNWPNTRDFTECPVCREPTMHSYFAPTFTIDKASELRLEFAFGWWLWDTGKL